MRVAYAQCFGFTREGEGGNAAGVILPEQDRLLTDVDRQATAQALGFAESVFVSSITNSEESAVVALRYFTPTAEVDLCGHATIACLGLLHARQLLGSAVKGELRTRAGVVGFRIDSPGERETASVFMEQLAPTIGKPLSLAKLEQLSAALGVRQPKMMAWAEAWAPRVASTGLSDLMLGVPSLEELRDLRPDMRLLSRLSSDFDVVGLHAFCPAQGDSAREVDYHVRNFAPLFGIDEESATGTSNCALACALQASGVLSATEFARRDAVCRVYGLGATLVFAQGDGMGAPSRILVQPPHAPPPPARGSRAHATPTRPWVGGRFAIRGGGVANLSAGAALARFLGPLQRCLPQPSSAAAEATGAAPMAASATAKNGTTAVAKQDAPAGDDRPPRLPLAQLALLAVAAVVLHAMLSPTRSQTQ